MDSKKALLLLTPSLMLLLTSCGPSFQDTNFHHKSGVDNLKQVAPVPTASELQLESIADQIDAPTSKEQEPILKNPVAEQLIAASNSSQSVQISVETLAASNKESDSSAQSAQINFTRSSEKVIGQVEALQKAKKAVDSSSVPLVLNPNYYDYDKGVYRENQGTAPVVAEPFQEPAQPEVQIPYKTEAQPEDALPSQAYANDDDQLIQYDSSPYAPGFPFQRQVMIKTRKAAEKSIYDQIGDFVPQQARLDQAQGFYSSGSLKNPINLLQIIKDMGEQATLRFTMLRDSNGSLKRNYYTTKDLSDVLVYLSKYAAAKNPDVILNPDNASAVHGGKIGDASHQNGLDIDIAYLLSNKSLNLQSVYRKVSKDSHIYNYLLAKDQWDLFKEAFRTGMVELFYVDPNMKQLMCKEAIRQHDLDRNNPDAVTYIEMLKRIMYYPGHDTHFHMRVMCNPKTNPHCIQEMQVLKTTGCRF